MDSGSQEVTVDIIIVTMMVEQDGWQSPEVVVRGRAVTADSGDRRAMEQRARRVCVAGTPCISGSHSPALT